MNLPYPLPARCPAPGCCKVQHGGGREEGWPEAGRAATRMCWRPVDLLEMVSSSADLMGHAQ